jgi:hypothetical protein
MESLDNKDHEEKREQLDKEDHQETRETLECLEAGGRSVHQEQMAEMESRA